MPGVAVFDVDHTLTRRSTGSRFVTAAMRQGVLPRRLAVALGWYTFAYRLGLVRLSAHEIEVPQLRGRRRADLVAIAGESWRSGIHGDLFPGAAELVAAEKAAGRRVALATSSLDIVVQPLADELGISDVLASSLEFVDGTCTGRFDGLPMFRAEKKKAVLAWLAAHGADPAECAFYSDSSYDLPLLEAVGRPVAVNPDWRLRRVARARGWRVIDLG